MDYSARARAAFRRGETDTVAELSHAEVARTRATGDAAGEVEALYMLSRLGVRAGDFAEARLLGGNMMRVCHLRTCPREIPTRTTGACLVADR